MEDIHNPFLEFLSENEKGLRLETVGLSQNWGTLFCMRFFKGRQIETTW